MIRLIGVPVVLPFEHAGQNLDRVAFLALRREFRLRRLALIEPGLSASDSGMRGGTPRPPRSQWPRHGFRPR